MKILYAIQGTGNGHLARAIELLPALQKRVQVDILVSGLQADIKLPFPIKYKLKGLSFFFGKNGNINYFKTFSRLRFFQALKDIKRCPVEEYDLVLNDFEPITAWACRTKGVKCFSVSHQSALLSPNVPKPNYSDWKFNFLIKYYAPADLNFGFHFKAYDEGIYLPIVRQNFRRAIAQKLPHYTVYLPAYSDKKIIKILSAVNNVEWQVFSKHAKEAYKENNVQINKISTEAFEKSLINCTGVICGAGFETPSEALHLKKKLLVIPMKGQYEQQCNAVSLHSMGVPTLEKLNKKSIQTIQHWTKRNETIEVYFPDNAQRVIDDILLKYIELTEKSIFDFKLSDVAV